MEGGTTVLGEAQWRRVAGFRVVMSWPQSGYAPPPRGPRSLPPASPPPGTRAPGSRGPGRLRARMSGIVGVVLILAGAMTVGYVIGAQEHAPQPSLAAAGAIVPPAFKVHTLSLPRSVPVAVAIPAIGVSSKLLHLGIGADGLIQVPSLDTEASEAAWYK